MSGEASERETTTSEARDRDTDQQPRRAEARLTRERLLDAALELFAERGFEATTTKLIAQRAGVPNGLIYYYFGTKEKLLETLFAERTFLPELSARVSSASTNTHADPAETLIDICTEFYTALQRNERFVRILSHESGFRLPAHLLLRQLIDHVLTQLETFLEDAQAAGKLKQLDNQMVAHALLSSIVVGALFRTFSEPSTSIKRLVDVLLGNSQN